MIRKTLFWFHLGAGLLAALPLSVMAFTGILLAFEPQIVGRIESDLRAVDPGQARTRADLDSLVFAARRVQAGRPTAVTVSSDPREAVQVRFGKDGTVWVDPWNAAVRGQTHLVHAAFGFLERIHRWLGSRELGGKVTGVSVLLCFLLSLTGFVLWWPRHLKALRHVAWPRRGLRGKARDWQWHNAVGFLSLPFLLVITLTGSVMAWPWAEGALYKAAGGEAPQRREAGKRPEGRGPAGKGSEAPQASWQAWSDTALAHVPTGWTSLSIRAPENPKSGAQVQVRTDSVSTTAGGTIALRPDGSFESFRPFRSDFATRLRFLVKPVHTGEQFGFVGQLLMALTAAGTLLLAWTGIAMSWRRFRPKPARA